MNRGVSYIIAALFFLLQLVPTQSTAAMESTSSPDTSAINGSGFNPGNSDDDYGEDDDLDSPNAIAPTRTSTDTLAIYDLRGRRITTPQRHTLYIYKGKKYVRR